MADESVLKHIGLIMDGNRRWAKAKGVPAIEGHRQGYKNLKNILHQLKQEGVEYVSIYAFSTENWNRSKDEVHGLMKLLRWVLTKQLDEWIKEERKLLFVGSREGLDADIVTLIESAEEKTAEFTGGTLAICFNYGGQQEIVDATRRIVAEHGEITTQNITDHLYQPDVPPLDLIVRTSGEHRTSNFMLWRATYAELAFTDTLWPDLSKEELSTIIQDFESRQRRYGK